MTKAFLIFIVFLGVIFPQNILDVENQLKIQNENHLNITFQNQDKAKKKPILAILYSAILPGMGELYAGDYSSGQYFTGVEAALWSIYIGMQMYGDHKKDNYRAYASAVGGVNLIGKDNDFFANIGNYTDIYQYNDDKAFNYQFKEMYDENEYYWKWKSEKERKEYRSMWLSSQNAYNNVRFVVGGMLLNRLVSIINAIRITAAYNRSLNEESSLLINFGISTFPSLQANINLKTAF